MGGTCSERSTRWRQSHRLGTEGLLARGKLAWGRIREALLMSPNRRGVKIMSTITYKIANRRRELELAFRRVYESYVRTGLIEPNCFRMRITPHHLLPTTDVIVSLLRREVMCTISLVRDSELALPMEMIYGPEVARRRDQGLRLAEASCLADRRTGVKRSLPMVLRIMALGTFNA